MKYRLFWSLLAMAITLSGVRDADAQTRTSTPAKAPQGSNQSRAVSPAELQPEELVFNGSFDNTNDPLKGWRFLYNLPGESKYANNHNLVSVVPSEQGRKGVLKLDSAYPAGTQVDSKPAPFQYGEQALLSIWGRADGGSTRVYVKGYKWVSGVKPHPDPELHELQEIYQGKVAFFDKEIKDGPMSGAGKEWKKAERLFPEDNISELAHKHLKPIRFMSVHIITIGKKGALYVDDVSVRKLKNPRVTPPVPTTKP